MGLLDMFRKLSSGAPAGGARRIIVDASRWPDGRGADRQSPRDQVQALQQITRFVRQEKLEAQVAFEGRPLREVSEDGDYNGLKVWFAEKQGGVGDLVIRLVQRSGPKGLLVFTADPALGEKVTALGAALMHISTLRKTLEGGAGGEQQEAYGPRTGDRDRGGRRRFGGRPSREGNGGGGGERGRGRGPGPAGDAGSSSPQHSAAVRNLIDLVEEPVRPPTPPAEHAPQPPAAPPPAAEPAPAPAPAPAPTPEPPPAQT